MADIQFDFDIDGTLRENPFLDRVEIHMMFDQTRHSLEAALQRKLADLTCPDHGDEPHVLISGRYDAEIEQFDVQYNIEPCCQRFLVQVVSRLNNVN